MPDRRTAPGASAVTDFQEEVKRVLLSRYTPAAVLVDDSLTVVHAHGPVGLFLDRPTGNSDANLMKIAKWGLAVVIRSAIQKVKSDDLPIRKGVVCNIDGAEIRLYIDVLTLRSGDDRSRRYLVLFKPAAADDKKKAHTLLQAEHRKHGTFAPLGREFRSVNAELATAKEELQTSNEELVMVNAELRQRNHDLAATNDDLSNLLASSQIPILMLDRKMRIRRFTPPAQRAFGLIPSDVGRQFAGLKLNIDAPRLEAVVREVIGGSFSAKQFEVRDHQDRWYSLWIRPYKTTLSAIDGAVLSMVDITEKRNGLRALEASRDYAEAIVDTVNDSLLVLDRHLKVKRASRSYYKQFMESHTDIEGDSIYELGKGRWNVPALRKHLSELAAHKTPFSGWEGDFEVPKLGLRTLAISGSVVPHGIESDMTIVLAIEDVSLRRQAAEAALLRKSEARQRDFVANVSHELLTPITAIKGYSESLVAGGLEVPGRRVKFAQIIEKHADRLAQLVEDLLQLSSYDAGRARAAPEAVSLCTAAEKLARSLAPIARKRLVSMRVLMPEKIKVSINRAELTQVLQNIFENAIKYNRRGGRVYIRARKIGKRAVVSVHDTGIGIPKEDLPRIFDRFHRAENARHKTARGNGLGLSIAQSILLNRGCRIWAESVEGKGSIIHFTLPISEKSRR